MTKPDTPARKASASSLSALALTAPVAMGYVPLGTVFGFLFVQAGGTWWLAVCASIFVFAGAAQYMMVPMVAAGIPVATIALATLAVNLRHIFYGLSLLNRLPKPWAQRWYLTFALTDETYSVITTLPAGTRGATMVLVAGLNQAWWVLGTAIGAFIGARATVTLAGLDFALVALFCVLAVEQWRSSASAMPLWTALLAYAVAYALLPGQALLISIALCVVASMVFHLRDQRVREAA
jgi:4-azaleucine resistance transporter AzlC